MIAALRFLQQRRRKTGRLAELKELASAAVVVGVKYTGPNPDFPELPGCCGDATLVSYP